MKRKDRKIESGKITGTILLVFSMSMFAFSQPAEHFIELAKKSNQGIKALNLDYQAALKTADQVDDYPDPIASLGIGVLPVETRLGAQRFRIGVSQMIPWKGLLQAKGHVAIANAETKAFQGQLQSIDVEVSVSKAYSTLIFHEQLKEHGNEQLVILAALEKLAKSAVKSGTGKLSSILFIARSREEVIADLKLLEKKQEQSTIMINRWAGLPFDNPIKIQIPSELILDIEEITAYATRTHPRLKAYETQITASASAVKLTKYESKPKIGIGLDYSWVSARNDVDIPRNGRDILMPMISASIPLNKSRYSAKRQQELLNQESATARIEDTKIQFQAEIEMALSKMELAEMTIDKYNELKEITRETLGLLTKEYMTEATGFEELFRIEMELIQYERKITEAAYEKALAIIVLKKYLPKQ